MMTPDAFKARLKELDLTHDEAAEWLGMSDRQMTRYAQGHTPVPKRIAMLLEGRGLDKGEK